MLRGFYSQTYNPGHHNFVEHFIFDPAQEEGLSPSIRAALEEANIDKMICESHPSEAGSIRFLGADGKLRSSL